MLAQRHFLKKIWLLAELFCRLPVYIYHCPVLIPDSNSLTTFELAWCHPGYQSTGHLAILSAAVKGRNPGQEFLNCCLWRGSMHFGCGKLPKIKTRYRDHLFGLCRRVISHRRKGQYGREHTKLNLINHSDRQELSPPFPEQLLEIQKMGRGAGNVVVPNCIYFYGNWKAQMKISAWKVNNVVIWGVCPLFLKI